MQDRVPLYPGRVKLTPVAGHENVYDMVRADQPTQEGTPLNKNSLLKDATAALFQLSGDTALPDKVFEILSAAALVGEDGGLVTPGGSPLQQTFIGSGTYTGTGTSSQSSPNSLTLPESTKILFVSAADSSRTYSNGTAIMLRGSYSGVYVSPGERDGSETYGGSLKLNISGDTWSWYSFESDPRFQCNVRSLLYVYVYAGFGG